MPINRKCKNSAANADIVCADCRRWKQERVDECPRPNVSAPYLVERGLGKIYLSSRSGGGTSSYLDAPRSICDASFGQLAALTFDRTQAVFAPQLQNCDVSPRASGRPSIDGQRDRPMMSPPLARELTAGLNLHAPLLPTGLQGVVVDQLLPSGGTNKLEACSMTILPWV